MKGFKIQSDIIIEFTYKNWKGEISKRKCVVEDVFFGNTEFHKEDQFLLKGFDLDKNDIRIYAIKDMKNVETSP